MSFRTRKALFMRADNCFTLIANINIIVCVRLWFHIASDAFLVRLFHVPAEAFIILSNSYHERFIVMRSACY